MLYMGVVVCPSIEFYWCGITRQQIMNAMSLMRFEQIKRYLHVSPPPTPLQEIGWSDKLQPMASILSKQFQELYLPTTNVAVDEMMVQFSSRSSHTVKMPNKPIGEGIRCLHYVIMGWDIPKDFMVLLILLLPTPLV